MRTPKIVLRCFFPSVTLDEDVVQVAHYIRKRISQGSFDGSSVCGCNGFETNPCPGKLKQSISTVSAIGTWWKPEAKTTWMKYYLHSSVVKLVKMSPNLSLSSTNELLNLRKSTHNLSVPSFFARSELTQPTETSRDG